MFRFERILMRETMAEPAVGALGAARVDAQRTLSRVMADLPADQREVIEPARFFFEINKLRRAQHGGVTGQ